jgi:putative redox protein
MWSGERTFLGESGTGNTITLGTTEREGNRISPSPMELVLIGTGGCTAWDVVNILEKGKQPINGCIVELDAERSSEEPAVFTKIRMHFVVKGQGLDSNKVKRAIELSATKYCSASAMLSKTADITHDFEVVEV